MSTNTLEDGANDRRWETGPSSSEENGEPNTPSIGPQHRSSDLSHPARPPTREDGLVAALPFQRSEDFKHVL